MTEDEAKKTQCCGPEGCGYFNELPWPARWCVASRCMAWRTDANVWERPGGEVIKTDREPADGRGHWATYGHCGLAGAQS